MTGDGCWVHCSAALQHGTFWACDECAQTRLVGSVGGIFLYENIGGLWQLWLPRGEWPYSYISTSFDQEWLDCINEPSVLIEPGEQAQLLEMYRNYVCNPSRLKD